MLSYEFYTIYALPGSFKVILTLATKNYSVKLSMTLLKGETQWSRLTWRHPVQYLKETGYSDLAAELIMIASQLLLYWLYRYLRCFVLDHFKI